MLQSLINALSQAANPWAFVAIACFGACAYLGKKTVDVLFSWPRPAEVERLASANDKLRAQLKKADEIIEEREATIRKQSAENMRLMYERPDPPTEQ